MNYTMNKICTDIEQSKKLLELGIDPQTADMIYYWFGSFELNDEWHELHLGTNRVNDKDILAWSFTALLSILPKGTRLLKSATDDTYHCDCPKGNIDKWFDNPVDAAFEMVCWLLENKKL